MAMRKFIKYTISLLLILSLFSCDIRDKAHEHTFDIESTAFGATCTEEGLLVLGCKCGEITSATIPPLGHEYGEWVIEKEATYTEEGVKSRTCKCGATERITVDMLRPVFEENFDGTTLNKNVWEKCPEWVRHDGGSIWDNRMSSLDGEGHLVLRAEWDAENNRVNCGAIRSKGLFEYGYGYFEASIKLPVITGVWGAFWINCGNISSVDGSAADGVEIDVIESIYNDLGYCNSALHWDGYYSAHQEVNSGHMTYDIYDGNFHLFAVERTEKGYVFYIDGVVVWRVYPYQCAPCPEPGFLELSLEATYNVGAGSEACLDTLPVEMIVDYVRVYETNPYK